MLGFNYIYKTPQEIFDTLGDISFMEISLIIIAPLFILFLNFIFFPWIIILQKHKNQEKEKLKKKKLLTQILLQKEIEDEVEKEIQIEDEQKLVP